MDELFILRDDSVERFLRRWHGSPPPNAGISPNELNGLALPPALRRFYEIAGRWPGVIVQNRLLAPDRLEPKDGKAVFYVENQGVCDWWTVLDENDGPVWVRDDGGPRERWFQEDEPLPRWLIQMAIFEATFASPHWAVAVGLSADSLPRALENLHETPLGPWRWPVYPTRFYAGSDAVACVNPTEPGDGTSFDVLIGTKEPEKVRLVESFRQ